MTNNSWQLDFLEKLVGASQGDARLANVTLRPRKVQVCFDHALMRQVDCWFDSDQLTDSNIKQVFVIECITKRGTDIDERGFRSEFEHDGRTGDFRFSGNSILFQYQWGTDPNAELPVHNGQVVGRLIDWTHGVLRLLFDHAERRHQVLVPTTTETTGPNYAVALEKYLEDLIVDQWDSLPWAEQLEYIDRQVTCGDIGNLDILARDRVSDEFVVIELKRDIPERKVVGQLSSYMGWIGQHRTSGAGVRGIIVAHTATDKLRTAVLPHANIGVYEYQFAVNLRPCELEHQPQSEEAS